MLTHMRVFLDDNVKTVTVFILLFQQYFFRDMCTEELTEIVFKNEQQCGRHSQVTGLLLPHA